jgi:alpha-glucosidase
LVVYQIYPRSFQDSNGDGEGDLQGIIARLDHVVALGADAIWLSPFYPSPLADGGYDVADYRAVDPRFGSLQDADALIAAAHERGLKVLFDVVPCHTSIEHPWFREHPDWYVWSDRAGPQNNWRSAFGGPAWSRDPISGRWYLHSFYPEQPDLNWRNPDVPQAFGDVLRFWLDRGVDGFRIDALDRILKDPQMRDDPPAVGRPELPEHVTTGLEPRYSRNAPDIGTAIAQLRAAAPDALLVGEVYLLSNKLAPYLEHLDACFSFELLHAGWQADTVRAAVSGTAATGKAAWVLSNHDFARLPNRVGPRNVRAAALLVLTLPGMAFIYQGDELGMADGPDGGHDRAGRDRHRTPMPWDDSPNAGFTVAEPWLTITIPPDGTAAEQFEEPRSVLAWYRTLVELRHDLDGDVEMLDAAPGVVAFRRGRHVIALNLGETPQLAPAGRELTLATPASTLAAIEPGGAVVATD